MDMICHLRARLRIEKHELPPGPFPVTNTVSTALNAQRTQVSWHRGDFGGLQ
ncbi:hypothetical protein KIN20_038310 [Parelaphostrongylus tenuis]|uniref:Uncharacterized protein n=1 Tax=Parelaphostrongylus tenuis TaxID=148309 RepID=A0AAD5REP2_PARTN|nr:hypothetical protein KIN20_038310 [Parelaphostrongylus tenuis]